MTDKLEESFVPEKIRWAMGGDTNKIYVTTDEVDASCHPKSIEKIEKFLNKNWAEVIALKERSKKILGLKTGLYSAEYEIVDKNDESKNWYGWWEADAKHTLEKIENIEREKEAQKRKELEGKLERVFSVEKPVGRDGKTWGKLLEELKKRAWIQEKSIPCESSEDCNVDIIWEAWFRFEEDAKLYHKLYPCHSKREPTFDTEKKVWVVRGQYHTW